MGQADLVDLPKKLMQADMPFALATVREAPITLVGEREVANQTVPSGACIISKCVE